MATEVDPQEYNTLQNYTVEALKKLCTERHTAVYGKRKEELILYKEGLIYQKWKPRAGSDRDVKACTQLVLPKQCQSLVLRIAHDVSTAGYTF